MEPGLRAARPADRPALEIVRQQAIEAAYAERYERDAVAAWVATPEAALAKWIDDDRFVVLVAETDVTQVGYAVGDRSSGRIEAIYVAPDYGRRGYGTALLEAIEARCAAAGASTLTVDAPAPVAAFFREQGFDRHGGPSDEPIPRVRLEKTTE